MVWCCGGSVALLVWGFWASGLCGPVAGVWLGVWLCSRVVGGWLVGGAWCVVGALNVAFLIRRRLRYLLTDGIVDIDQCPSGRVPE